MAIKCPKCNADNPDTSRFCADCGTQIVSIKDASVTKTLQKPTKGFKKNTVIAKKYKIIEKLGEGGMGIVYKAKDTKLDRSVALKFLPIELTRDEEAKKRFVQEARATAALNHSHICTIYEIDEADDQTFISMEYIEGQSLKDKLKEESLDVNEAKDIAIKVAEGLKEAHEKGIVHRDIKPANIMLTKKGQAKITDFGLAKLSWGADLTKPATIMGTVAYMSPEQAKGEKVGHRTDIWSLGAVLYEMLTGFRPFKKDKEHELIYEILNEEPTPVTSLRPDIPRHFEEVVHKSLKKDVGNRFQTMNGLIQNLKQSPPIILPKAECSIVVLPFEDMSPNKDNEYFSDGLTEEIITDLSQIHELCVISRNSSMALKGTKKNTKTIGRELNIQYVLEGSVRKAGNNLRITAQLIDARTDVHLWAKKYSGTMDDVFDIQEKVSRSIVDALKLELTPAEQKKLSEKTTDDVRAYECYLKAREEINKLTKEGMDRAFLLIKTGMRIIGENELLYNALGTYYMQLINARFERDENHFKKAEECIDKIFNINPESSYGHYLRGFFNWKRGYVQESVKNMKQALTINPTNPDVLIWLGYIYGFSGKNFAGSPLFTKAFEIDPLFSLNYALQAACQMWDGQFELALSYAQTFMDMDPANEFSRFMTGMILLFNHRTDDACELFNLAAQDSSENMFGKLSLLYKSAIEGDKNRVMSLVTSDLKTMIQSDEALPLFLAPCYAMVDEKKEAIDWLEEAVNWGFINYPFLNEYNPFLENIRGEPRFKKLMERVKHEWENFEV